MTEGGAGGVLITYSYYVKKIQLIQNYAARVIAGNVGKYDHVSPVLKELGWLPIKEHLQYRDAVLVHKCMYNQEPSYLIKSDVHKEKSNP